MTLHKTRHLQRQGRDKKQAQKFFLTLGVITVLLIIILYFIFGS